jgi:rhomboid protease GluP
MKLRKTLLSKPFRPWSYPVVSVLLLIFLGCSSLLWGHHEFASRLTASREEIFQQHEYYRLFTTLAMHANLGHFLGNAIFFGIFGFLLNSYFGFLWFPVLSIFFGAIINAFTLALYPPNTVLLGASGVVYFMAGAWATLFILVERKSHWLKRVMAAMAVSLILFFPTSYEPEVSYLAHGIGFAIGIAVAFIYFQFARTRIRREELWERDWVEYLGLLDIQSETKAGLPTGVDHVDFFDTD